MAIRKRKTKIPPAPERRYAQEAADNAANRASAPGVGGGVGAAGGAGIGAAVGTLITPGIGTAIGAGIGATAGYLAGSSFGSSFSDEANARFAMEQGALDAQADREALMIDMEMEAASRDYAMRMSALEGISQNTTKNNAQGYKWGGYMRR